MIVIEMNPRVSRSSALASKATGFPIAKIAAKLAVGYRLHELPNDITRETMACFEPTIDYVVTKIPRFAFEKFPEADATLTTQMKSVGETMAIGRTFKESFQKALRGLEVGSFGFGCDGKDLWGTPEQPTRDEIRAKLATPNDDRVWYLRYAFKSGMSVDEIYRADAHRSLVPRQTCTRSSSSKKSCAARRHSARRSATTVAAGQAVRLLRSPAGHDLEHAARSTFAPSASAAASSPRSNRSIPAPPSSRPTRRTTTRPTKTKTKRRPSQPGSKRIMILGGGPNRIGQGIEFDYCCCHASFALRELGIESIMVNSNPETVSTDYDTSDLLFFEPLTTEDVLNICDRVQPDGVIVQFGGQTPLNLARALGRRRRADHRHQRRHDRRRRRSREVPAAAARARTEAAAQRHRPHDGRGPRAKRPRSAIRSWCGPASCSAAGRWKSATTTRSSSDSWPRRSSSPQGQPVLIDQFLEDATEVDVDCISDGQRRDRRRHHGAHRRSRHPLGRLGLCDSAVQFAGPDHRRNSRGHASRWPSSCSVDRPDEHPVRRSRRKTASRCSTCSKSIRAPAARCRSSPRRPACRWPRSPPKSWPACRWQSRASTRDPIPSHVSVKESVFPFLKFAGVDIVLGPEMRSTGEVMGISERFSIAFAKSQLAAGTVLPQRGQRSSSASPSRPRSTMVGLATRLGGAGLQADGHRRAPPSAWRRPASRCTRVNKLQEGHPNLLDYLIDGGMQLIMNTPSGKGARTDEGRIRAAAVAHGVPCITTIQAADAAVRAMEALRDEEMGVQALQDRFASTDRVGDPRVSPAGR